MGYKYTRNKVGKRKIVHFKLNETYTLCGLDIDFQTKNRKAETVRFERLNITDDRSKVSCETCRTWLASYRLLKSNKRE